MGVHRRPQVQRVGVGDLPELREALEGATPSVAPCFVGSRSIRRLFVFPLSRGIHTMQVKYGYDSIQDVRNARSRKLDRMESFFLAETMKYMYLIHDPDHGTLRCGHVVLRCFFSLISLVPRAPSLSVSLSVCLSILSLSLAVERLTCLSELCASVTLMRL